MKSSQEIGKTLKRARKKLKLTQERVAEKAGISSTHYSMIERGEVKSPGAKPMAAIAKVFKINLSEIISA